MTNNILVNHTVGITVAQGNSAILNGVLWHGNTVNTGGSGTITVSNAHTGNPAFAADGYHLTTSSAAIDQGVAAGVTSDIDGDPRPMGHGVDLGADEFRVALNVTQQAFPDTVEPGKQLTYTISVANTGDVDLKAIITDTRPTQVTAGGTVFLPNGRSGITWTAVITAPGGVEGDGCGHRGERLRGTTDQSGTGHDGAGSDGQSYCHCQCLQGLPTTGIAQRLC